MLARVLTVAVVGALLLASCGRDASEDDGAPAKREDMDTIVLTEADSGRTVDVMTGMTLELRLPANRTTGYRWAVEEAGAPVLAVIEDTYVVAEDPQMGTGGTRILRYRVQESGTGRLRLKYWQEWEGDSSIAERFEASVRAEE